MKKKLVIVGAGKEGKGNLGDIFSESGNYQITFLDKDPLVINALNEAKKYTVEAYYADHIERHEITNYQAYLLDVNHPCEDVLQDTDLILLALYPEDIPDAAKFLKRALNHQLVAQGADVGHAHKLFNRGLAGCDLNGHFGKEQTVHVAGKGFALALGVAVLGRSSPLAVIVHGAAFGLHFVIGIEPAAGLFPGLDQGFTGHADGVAHHELRTGTAGRAAHGGLGGVVHDKADLVGGNIQGTQGLVNRLIFLTQRRLCFFQNEEISNFQRNIRRLRLH